MNIRLLHFCAILLITNQQKSVKSKFQFLAPKGAKLAPLLIYTHSYPKACLYTGKLKTCEVCKHLTDNSEDPDELLLSETELKNFTELYKKVKQRSQVK